MFKSNYRLNNVKELSQISIAKNIFIIILYFLTATNEIHDNYTGVKKKRLTCPFDNDQTTILVQFVFYSNKTLISLFGSVSQ